MSNAHIQLGAESGIKAEFDDIFYTVPACERLHAEEVDRILEHSLISDLQYTVYAC